MWILHRPDFQFSFPIIELQLRKREGVARKAGKRSANIEHIYLASQM